MKEIVAKLKERVKQGKELAGDSLLIEYERYEEELKRWRKTRFVDVKGLKELAKLVERQKRQGKKIDLKQLAKRFAGKRGKQGKKRSTGKYKTPPPPEPGALTGSEDEKETPRWFFRHRYVKLLLPDLQDYVPYIYDKVLTKSKGFQELATDWMKRHSEWKRHRRGEEPAHPAVGLLFKYGCKQVSRLMPGFAKVVLKRIRTDMDMMGDWEAPIDPEAFARKVAKGKTQKQPELKEEKKPRIVEICTVTHLQLEATLRKDLGIIVRAMKRSTRPHDGQIQPLSAKSPPGRHARSAPRRGKTPVRRKKAAPRASRSARKFGGHRSRPRPKAGRSRGRPRRSRSVAGGKLVPCHSPFFPKPRLMDPEACKRQQQRITGLLRKGLKQRAALNKLWEDLGKYDPALKGEKFHGITKRLLSFYRKQGEVRNFARAMTQSGDKIKDLGKPENLPKDDGALKEMKHHAKPKVVKIRNHRELVGRQVEQWTYGYEYDQLAGHLKSGAKKRGSGLGRLLGSYVKAEREVLDEFWQDCGEIRAICQAPQSGKEKEACVACAVEALQERCLDGKEKDREGTKKGHCKGEHTVEYYDYPAKKWVKLKSPSSAFTLRHWLNLEIVKEMHDARFHRGDRVLNTEWFQAGIIGNLIARRFFPGEKGARPQLSKSQKNNLKTIGLPIKDDDTSNEGKRNLDSLPITTWQRCVLFNPYHGNGKGQRPDHCDQQQGKFLSEAARRSDAIPWHRSKMFAMALGNNWVRSYFDKLQQFWRKWCKDFGRRKKRDVCTGTETKWSRPLANTFFKRGKAGSAGTNRDKNLGKAGSAISGAVGPVVGKLLGMLLKAAGLYEMMKTLATAAGLTPEQSADCEDPEYRHEVMKLPQNQDHKRGCLLKVFAKNFVNVLESIIIMLGNKLVDWAVDLLRTALQGVKSALLSAAGSVPFAGGFLATLVDIAWELIMNFGAKMLLKSFVVAKLPGWLQIYKLSKLSWEELLDNPIIQVVAGIIITLIDAAVTYGEKSWMAVGVDTAINIIQVVLQETKQWFWLRALTYAKKEMRRAGTGAEGQSLQDQLLGLARGMVGGFGAAITRRLDADARDAFQDAVDSIQELLTPARFGKLMTKFQSKPVEALVELIGEKIGPVAIPVIAAFVSMPPWAKELLQRIGTGLSETLEAVRKRRFDAKQLVGTIAKVVEPVGKHFLGRLPIADAALKRMILGAYEGLLGVLKNVDQIESKYLQKPWRIVRAVVELTGDYIKGKVADLIKDPKLEPERTLLTDAVGAILDVLGNEGVRKRLFSSRGPDSKAILAKVAELVKPYASARLRSVLAGTGVEGLVDTAVEALFGPEGPFVRGEAFFRDLASLLGRKAESIASSALEAVKGLITAGAKALGSGPAGKILGNLGTGLMGSLSGALGGRGGLKALLRQGAAGALKLARDALRPLLDALAPAPSRGSQASPLNTLLRGILGGLLDFFGEPSSLSDLVKRGVAALGKLAKRVAVGLRDSVKSLVGGAVKDPELRALAEQGIDGFFALLSDPSRITRFSGEKVLGLLKEVGLRVFAFVKSRVLALLARSQLGPARAALQSLLNAVLDEVQRIIGDPARLRALVEGGTEKLLGFLAGIFTQPVQKLVEGLVPPSLRDAIGNVLGKVMGWISKAGELAKATVSGLLKKLGPALKGLLEGVLRSVVPPDTWATIQAAIAKVQAVLANPAGLLKQAGKAARQAIDQVIAAVLVQIPDGGLRGLASSVVAMLRDLVSKGGTGDRLRRSGGALLERIVDAGAQYLTSLLPSGPVQRLIREAIEGLRGLLGAKGGFVQALAQRASALWPGVQRALVSVIGSVFDRISDRQVGGVLKGLVSEVVGLMSDPERWQRLKREGVGYLFSRLLPVAREFASGMLGRLVGQAGEVRAVVEGLFRAASDLFTNPKRLVEFAKNAVSELVSMGVQSVTPVVLNLVRQATGNQQLVDFLRSAMTEVKRMLAEPAKLRDFLKMKAPQALAKIIDKAQGLVQGLVSGVIRDKDLRALAKEGIAAVLDFVKQAISGGGRDLGGAAKAILAKLIPALAKMAKGKLLGLFPHHLRDLRQVVADGFDRLVSFGTDLITKGKAAWQKLTGGGSKLFGRLVKAVLSLLEGPITRGIGYAPLRGLLKRLLAAVSNLLADPAALVRAFRSAGTAMGKLLPELEKVIGPFAEEVLVNPLRSGIGRDLVAALIDTGRGFLKNPKKLEAFIRQARADWKGLLRRIVSGLIPPLMGKMGRTNKTLKAILEVGMNMMLEQFLK